MLAKADTELLQKLKENFPLFRSLRFRWREGRLAPEALPPAIALFAAMTNPEVPGAACLLVPSREDIASFAAVLTALQAALLRFPALRDDYVNNSFTVGERVRVLPSGHVYRFGGYMEYDGKRYFRLKLVDDDLKASRMFPISEAVRLEKTTKNSPKGKGNQLGAFQRSELDFLIGTELGGNSALFMNEVVLVTTQKSFTDFIERMLVSTVDNPGHEFPLRDVISWGVVNFDGELEFRNSAAATGAPLIAVSPRAEYVANFCRQNGKHNPRIIVDGASRLKDIQALDDIVDHSKLLIVAGHSDLDLLNEFEKRDCRIWKFPELVELVGERTELLGAFYDAYSRESKFKLTVVECESKIVDEIGQNVGAAEQILRDSESDETISVFINIAFARLLDVCSLVHGPVEAETRDIREKIHSAVRDMEARKYSSPLRRCKT